MNALAWQDSAGKYIYGFRKNKQFSAKIDVARHRWEYNEDSYLSTAASVRALFRFHLQFHKNLGYLVGTSAGFDYYFPDNKERSGFYALALPSVTAGLVWYVSPEWQLLLTAEAYLHYLPKLSTTEHIANAVILESARVDAMIERFFSLNAAANLGFAFDATRISIKREIQQFKRSGWRVSIGFTYHLL